MIRSRLGNRGGIVIWVYQSLDDPRFWVIEPEATEVVRRNYQMALDGYGLAETAAALEKDGIVSPQNYWKQRGDNRGGAKSNVAPTKWGHTSITKILHKQEYCGDVINFKTHSKSYKMKKRIDNPVENQAVFLNVHEPIIDRATWEKVQQIRTGTRRKWTRTTPEPNIFTGLLKCPECGGNLNYPFNQGNHDIKFFSCQNHNTGLRPCSKTHYIRVDFLEQVVLGEIHRLTRFAEEYENDFVKAIIGQSAKITERERATKQRQLDALLARNKELDRLYEDNVSGKISDERFAKMSRRYEQEQDENVLKIKSLRVELEKDSGKQMTADMFLDTVRQYSDAQKLTRRMLTELIDHIDVYHAKQVNGVKTQQIVIYYNCIGAFTVPERRNIPEVDVWMHTRKGVAVSYSTAKSA